MGASLLLFGRAVLTAAAVFTVLSFIFVVEAKKDDKFRPASGNGRNPLIFAQVMWRHGDRAPNAFWTKDPFASSFPQGAGQLTTRGWEQQYALGQFLRERYGEFLNLDTTGLSYADIYVRSTDVERAIASAEANIAAFFKPSKKSKKRSDWETHGSDLHKEWQPVPIHTVPEKDDYVMHQNECDQLDVLKKQFENTKAVQDLKRSPAVQNVFRGLSQITGEPMESWTISKTFKSLADTLNCERVHDMVLPGVPVTFYDAVEQLRERTWVMPYENKPTAQLRGGCILNTIAQNMRNKLDAYAAGSPALDKKDKKKDPYSSRKLVLFSGHDTSLLGLISSAGLLSKVGAKPPYAASIYFELYADGTVDISYKNDTHTLKTIRNGQPVSLIRAPLSSLENMWKDARVTEEQLKSKCYVPEGAKNRALDGAMVDDNDDYGED